MPRLKLFGFALVLGATACRSTSSVPKEIVVSAEDRQNMVKNAYVYQGIDSPHLKTEKEVKDGPVPEGSKEGETYFKWGDEVNCKFSESNFASPLETSSPQFLCDVVDSDGKVVAPAVTISYHKRNPQVYTELAAARLLWLLGYPSNNYFAVNVHCLGCPTQTDPAAWVKKYQAATDSEKEEMRSFIQKQNSNRAILHLDPAVLERKWAEEVVIEKTNNSGWSFIDDLAMSKSELKFEPAEIEDEIIRRQALVLLATLIGHVENQQLHQRLYCRRLIDKEHCAPFSSWLLIHDLGSTLGGYPFQVTSDPENPELNLAMSAWKSDKITPIFADSNTCEATISAATANQTFGETKRIKVTEEARRFLLSRFVALGGGKGDELNDAIRATLRKQFEKIFIAGRNGDLYESTSWWVDTLMAKLDLLASHKGCR